MYFEVYISVDIHNLLGLETFQFEELVGAILLLFNLFLPSWNFELLSRILLIYQTSLYATMFIQKFDRMNF